LDNDNSYFDEKYVPLQTWASYALANGLPGAYRETNTTTNDLSATRKLYNHQYYDPSALAAYYADSDDQLTLQSPSTDKFTAKYSNITSKAHLLKNVQAMDSQSTLTSSVSTKFGQSPEIAADTREILDNAVENVLKSSDIETVTLRQVVQQVEDIIGCKLTSHEQRYVSEQIDKCLDEL
jgi:hypothetical protein